MRVFLVLNLCAAAAMAEWVPVGPDGGYIQAFAVNPQQANELFAVSYDYPDNARLFSSTDAGASWTLTGRLPYYSIGWLAVDPFDADRLYANARSNAIYCSDDGGANWTSHSLPGYAQAIEPDPQAEGKLYGGGYYYYNSNYRAALYVSTDYGSSWSVAMPQPESVNYCYSCAADPVHSGTVYIGASRGFIYRTTDSGASWTLANSGIPATASVQGLTVNADGSAVLASTSSGIFRSTDSGGTWTLTTGSPTSATLVRFSPGDKERAWTLGRVDSIRVHVSTDGGATWIRPTPGYTTAKTASLVPDPVTGSQAYLNTQTGIFRSTDMGGNWNEAHTGLRLARISTISTGPENSGRVYLEVSENGVYKSSDRGTNWTRTNDFLSCGNICGIGVVFDTYTDILYALEGSG